VTALTDRSVMKDSVAGRFTPSARTAVVPPWMIVATLAVLGTRAQAASKPPNTCTPFAIVNDSLYVPTCTSTCGRAWVCATWMPLPIVATGVCGVSPLLPLFPSGGGATKID
jgi:hypothetical protein